MSISFIKKFRRYARRKGLPTEIVPRLVNETGVPQKDGRGSGHGGGVLRLRITAPFSSGYCTYTTWG